MITTEWTCEPCELEATTSHKAHVFRTSGVSTILGRSTLVTRSTGLEMSAGEVVTDFFSPPTSPIPPILADRCMFGLIKQHDNTAPLELAE